MSAIEVCTVQQPLLNVRNLRTYFHYKQGVVRAVDGVDVMLDRGKTLGIVGESGSGKSVTAKSILRLIAPPGKIESGEIRFRDNDAEVDIAALDPTGGDIRRIRGNRISMIFQEPMTSLSPVHTIGDQIAEALLLHRHGVPKREALRVATEMLDEVGIPSASARINNYTFELSGGMRQRAMIAMALICDPALLIADEPTTAVDVTIQAEVLDLIAELQRVRQMSLMLITHDLSLVAEVADSVAIMYLGKVVEYGSVYDIYDNPLHPYTVGLLQSIPKLADETQKTHLSAIRGYVPDPYSVPLGCPFVSRCDRAIAGVCDTREPPNREVAPGHWTRCFLYE